jgi:hypothetical protein
MPQRLLLLFLSAVVFLAAAPAPKRIAPDSIAHPNAIFLRKLSNDGKDRVQFRATATGSHFFFEEPAGVTVYVYDGSGYKKVEFVKGATLPKVVKKYGTK